MSSNCSANAARVSAMMHFLSQFGGVLIWRAGDNRSFLKIMFRRRRRGLPFQTGRFPRIGRRFFAMLKRPNKIDQRKQITCAENRSAGAGHYVVNLKLGRISVVPPGHPEVTKNELRKKGEVKSDIHDQSRE